MVVQVASAVESQGDVGRVCRDALEEWASLDDASIAVGRLTGGITNDMFYAEVTGLGCDDVRPRKVVVRVFGASDGSRSDENACYEVLSGLGLAPQYLAGFANGRIELFLPYKTLTRHVRAVASELARLHRSDQSGAIGRLSAPISLWDRIGAWQTRAAAILREGKAGNGQQPFPHDLADLSQRAEQVKRVVQERYRSAQVFCHNDLLAANVLWDETAGRVQLIDFEYGATNDPCYDVGNHFAEWMGGTEDGIVHIDGYPSPEQQLSFCRSYLGAIHGRVPEETEVATLASRANVWSLVSHLYWGFWGVCQAVDSTVDFNYYLFSINRLGAFKHFAEEFKPLLT